jgi:transposase
MEVSAMSTPGRSAYIANALPIYAGVMERIELPQLITQAIGKRNSQAEVDAGTIVAAMVHNILSNEKVRLVRLPTFFSDKPMPLLFPWRPDLHPDDINQYRAGDVLDQFFDAGPQRIFSEITRSLAQRFDISTNIIHADTTSKSFQGVFEGHESPPVNITFGHPKDHRPDLKQIMFGVGVSSDGLPLVGEVLDGNTSDKTFNSNWIPNVREWLGREADDPLIYVADSAAVTPTNLELFAAHHIDFVTRLPHTYNLADELAGRAARDERRAVIGPISDKKGAAEYRSVGLRAELSGEEYRFIVYHSSAKDGRKLRSLKKAIKRERKDLAKRIEEFCRQEFYCEKDARESAQKFLKKCKAKLHAIPWSVEKRTVAVKRKKRGRPPKGYVPETESRWVATFAPEIDKAAVGQEEEKAGMFVLITTLDEAKFDDAAVLRLYKEQDGVERIFRILKSPSLVGAYCLESPRRIVAFGFVVLIAVTVHTFMECMVRRELAKEGAAPIEGLYGEKTHRPTANAIQEAFTPIIVREVHGWEADRIEPDIPLNENQKRILGLCGLDESVYSRLVQRPPRERSDPFRRLCICLLSS